MLRCLPDNVNMGRKRIVVEGFDPSSWEDRLDVRSRKGVGWPTPGFKDQVGRFGQVEWTINNWMYESRVQKQNCVQG